MLGKAITTIQVELNAIGGDAHRGCWLDSTKGRTGTKTYTGLRWFIDIATKNKGSGILKVDEVDTLEADLARVGAELRKVEELAGRLGLQLPSVSSAQIEVDGHG